MTDHLDVAIIGAGLGGAAAATVLGRGGMRIAIIDPSPQCKPVFKAEKIEPDQVDLLRRLSLFEAVLPHVTPIRSVTEAHYGWRLRTHALEQYGVRYEDLVNAVRRQIPPSTEQHLARLVGFEPSSDLQTLILSSGARLPARLVVVATGTAGGRRLRQLLGVDHQMVRAPHSLCSGFDVEPQDRKAFAFESLTYWSDRVSEAIDYVTFFPVPDGFRVNLFSYRDPTDPWVHALAQDPVATLHRAIPRLRRVTGRWRLVGKVETRVIDLYVAQPPARPGLVLVGDAFQSVCPATGTGLTKVLTDVERLCHAYVPGWLRTSGMGTEKTSRFYADSEKVASDQRSLAWAEHRRHSGTDRSLGGWLHRHKSYALVALDGWRWAARRTRL